MPTVLINSQVIHSYNGLLQVGAERAHASLDSVEKICIVVPRNFVLLTVHLILFARWLHF